MDPCGYRQHYGILITRDDQPWFVPLDGDSKSVRASEAPLRLANSMTRCARHQLGVDGEHFTLAIFFTEHIDEPSTGEYVFCPNEDGTWELQASPWMSGASEEQVLVAEHEIALALEAEAVSCP